MDSGQIAFFNNDDGYGFISSENYDEDVFFHPDSLDINNELTIREGYDVEFDAVESENGWKAVSLEILVEEDPKFDSVQVGEISFFDTEKGFGFVQADDIEEDVFFHVKKSDFDFVPKEGLTVNMEVENAPKGPFANRLKKVDSPINDILADDSGENFLAKDEYNGEVNYFNSDDGYGFIETDELDDDVFFHVSDLSIDSITEGESVQIKVKQADEGPKAVSLTVSKT
jgi:CspA family cold shock protein